MKSTYREAIPSVNCFVEFGRIPGSITEKSINVNLATEREEVDALMEYMKKVAHEMVRQRRNASVPHGVYEIFGTVKYVREVIDNREHA